MTTPDLFTVPAPAAVCRRCKEPVLRVRDEEIGIRIDLDPTPLPVTRPIPADRPIWENHPRIGWHSPSSPARRGFPVHLIHRCKHKHKPESEHKR